MKEFPSTARASAIFPMFFSPDNKNKIIFLNYWKMKNNLADTLLIASLRNKQGKLIEQITRKIADEPFSSEIDLERDFSNSIDKLNSLGFNASLEVEMFFKEKPLFNYPALILNYENNHDSSYVHSSLRLFDKDEFTSKENLIKNQTGFDVFLNQKLTNYIIFVCGDQSNYEFSISLETNNKKYTKCIQLIDKQKYELVEFNIDDIFYDVDLADAQVKVSIDHNISDIYPRFYVGNYSKLSNPTTTHTFYDERQGNADRKIKNKQDDSHDASFSFPILDPALYDNSLSSYASNDIWSGDAKFELLNFSGELLFSKPYEANEDFSLFNIGKVNINSLVNEAGLDLNSRIICKVSFDCDSEYFPMRHKYGLNYSHKGGASKGTNICFAPTVFNNENVEKKFSRTWGPVGGPKNIIFFFNNTSNKEYKDETENILDIKFFNCDGETLTRKRFLDRDQCVEINVQKDSELKSHFKGKVGWCFCVTDNNFYNAWYLSIGKTHIGGDHTF